LTKDYLDKQHGGQQGVVANKSAAGATQAYWPCCGALWPGFFFREKCDNFKTKKT